MKKKLFIPLLLAAAALTSCVKEVNITRGNITSNYYNGSYTTFEKTLEVNLHKGRLASDTGLLVVNVDNQSDTTQNSDFSKKYTLSKGSHTLGIEYGVKDQDGVYHEIKSTTMNI